MTAEVDPKTWKPSDPPDVHVKVKVSDDAPAGDYTVTVTATPSKGNPTPVVIKIKVPDGNQRAKGTHPLARDRQVKWTHPSRIRSNSPLRPGPWERRQGC